MWQNQQCLVMSLSSSTVGGRTKYKIVLLGDQQVGKTSIIERFINNRFQQSYNATIGIDFLVKNLIYKNKSYRLQLWDTAGQQRFRSLIPSYLKDSHLCILVYDVSNPASLDSLPKWMELYDMHREYAAFSVAVGNKCDLASRKCTAEQVKEKLPTLKENQKFIISAKEGKGIEQMFHSLIDLINNRLDSIKIIDQIEQKPQENEREDRNEAQTVKPVLKYESTLVTLGAPQEIAVSEPKKSRKKCC